MSTDWTYTTSYHADMAELRAASAARRGDISGGGMYDGRRGVSGDRSESGDENEQ